MGKQNECKKIVDYSLLFCDSETRESFTKHLAECRQCGRDYDVIAKIVFPSNDNNRHSPSDEVELRIIKSFDKLSQKLKSQDTKSKVIIKKFFRPFLISAAAVFILFTISFLYDSYKESEFNKNVTISYKNSRGNVTVNNKTADNTGKIYESNVIKTGDDSIVELFFNDIFKIKITCNTTFKIEKAEFDWKNNIFNFSFNLIDGVVLSKIDRFSRHQLSFRTTNSNFIVADTEFLLSAHKDKTTLLLSDGSLNIKPKQNEQEISAIKDKKYIITDRIIAQLMDNEDRRMIDFVQRSSDMAAVEKNESRNINNISKGKSEMVAHNVPCDKALSRIYESEKEKEQ